MANEAVEYIKDVWDGIVHGKKNKRKKSEAVNEIEEFLQEYAADKVPQKDVLPDVPAYERVTYEAPDDAQIEKDAQKELAAYKAQGEKGIEKEIDALRKQYDSQKETARTRHENAEKEASAEYEAAKRNTDHDMLKRGLARSSIAAGKKAALEQGEAEQKARLYATYAAQTQEIDDNIAALSVRREEALNDFNLSYAAKLTERINALKSEREEKTAAAVKYNNALAEKEHAAAVDKKMKESDLYSEALTQKQKENALYGEARESDYAAAYAVIAEKLRAIGKSDARDIVLNNPNVRGSVGNTYYYKLYDEFCR